jgi:hypothetical protein
MSKKSLKTNLIGLLVLIVTLAFVILPTTTYAFWQEKISANKEVVIPVGKYNPSLKYLIFKGLNNAGEFATSEITKYAVVGYYDGGLVAEIIIPEVVMVQGVNYPVVMIATDPNNTSYRLRENKFITSIVIPASVTEIKAGALSGMTSLSNVILEGTEEDVDIEIGDLAFAYCTSLANFSCLRNIVGDPSSYFLGTMI